MSKINHLVKHVTPPAPPPTRFDEVEPGAFFHDCGGVRDTYQKVIDHASGKLYALRIRDGNLCHFSNDHTIDPFGDADEIVIKMWRTE